MSLSVTDTLAWVIRGTLKTSKQSKEILNVNTTNLGGIVSYEFLISTQNWGNIGEGLGEKLVYIDFEREIEDTEQNKSLPTVHVHWSTPYIFAIRLNLGPAWLKNEKLDSSS